MKPIKQKIIILIEGFMSGLIILKMKSKTRVGKAMVFGAHCFFLSCTPMLPLFYFSSFFECRRW